MPKWISDVFFMEFEKGRAKFSNKIFDNLTDMSPIWFRDTVYSFAEPWMEYVACKLFII